MVRPSEAKGPLTRGPFPLPGSGASHDKGGPKGSPLSLRPFRVVPPADACRAQQATSPESGCPRRRTEASDRKAVDIGADSQSASYTGRLLTLGFLLLCIVVGGIVSVAMRNEDRKYGWLWWIPIAYLVVTGYFAFVYQGYREDAGSPPAQTWPLGVVSLPLAAIMAWTALRKRPPGELHLALIILAFVALALWAWLPGVIESP